MLVTSDWLLVAGYLLMKTNNKQPETSNKQRVYAASLSNVFTNSR